MDIKLNQLLHSKNLIFDFRVQSINLKLDSFQPGTTHHQPTLLTAETLLQLFS